MGETAVEVDEVAGLGAEVVVADGGAEAWEAWLTLGCREVVAETARCMGSGDLDLPRGLTVSGITSRGSVD